MFRKGALLITVLAAVFSALFSWLVDISNFADNSTMISLVCFMMYFLSFIALFGSIYDIFHKVKIKANKYLLGSSISGIIAYTVFFKMVSNFNIYLDFVFVFALGCAIVLGNIGSQYEGNNSTKND